MLEKAIIELLSTSEIVELVNDRVLPSILGDEETPAIVYNFVGGSRQSDISFSAQRVQFSCFAKTYKEARRVQTQVRKTFERYIGVSGGIHIKRVTVEGESIVLYDDKTKTYNVIQDYRFLYREE